MKTAAGEFCFNMMSPMVEGLLKIFSDDRNISHSIKYDFLSSNFFTDSYKIHKTTNIL